MCVVLCRRVCDSVELEVRNSCGVGTGFREASPRSHGRIVDSLRKENDTCLAMFRGRVWPAGLLAMTEEVSARCPVERHPLPGTSWKCGVECTGMFGGTGGCAVSGCTVKVVGSGARSVCRRGG